MLDTLDHVVIAVRDLEAASSTYAALFGRAPSWRGEHADLGTANTLFRLRNTYVELLSSAGDGPMTELVRSPSGTGGEGPLGLAFGTADAEALAACLRDRGASVAGPIAGSGRERTTGVERHWRNVYFAATATRGVMLFAIQHLSPPAALPAATAIAAEEGTVSALDHAVIMTSDAEASIAVYRDLLGLRLAFDKTFEQRGLRLIFFSVGGITVELAAPLAASDPAAPDRFWGLSYRVDDIDAARARVAAAGFDVSDVRRGHKSDTRVCTVRRETHGVATLFIQDSRHEKR
jgi:catechol 2,3-dioxygenase-like lactoylglutathione lyase family enzyme